MIANSPFVYCVYGLTLISDTKLTLPEARAGRGGASKIVRFETTEAQNLPSASDVTPDPDQWFQQTVCGDGSVYMRWKDLFDFLITVDGARVSCRNLSGCAFEFLEAYVMNYAVSSALIQQGEETLHSTVVDIGGRAIGLLGASGAGKSTLASFLRSRGGDIVTDDMLRITIDEETALAHPGPHRLKLFQEPAGLFLPGASTSGRWSPVGGKFIYDLGDPAQIRPARRLTALFHLQAPRQPDDRRVVLERLTGLDRFQTIGGSTMNNALQTRARSERHFRFVNRLATMLPVFRLTYPRTFDAFDEVADNIHGSAPA